MQSVNGMALWNAERADKSEPYQFPGLPAGQVMKKAERVRTLIDLLRDEEYASVNDLSTKLGVSVATVRRDLQEFAAQGFLTRTHGGALFSGESYEVPVRYRRSERMEDKRRIGAAAAAEVSDSLVVGITGGTTTTEIARRLPSRLSLTVVTNALNIATSLALRPKVRLVDTGGIARSASFELVGPIAESTISRYHLDLLFLGVDGIDVSMGCTTHDDGEAHVNAAMVENADRVVVVADSSKIGRRAFARICELRDVSLLITDIFANPSTLVSLEEAGICVQQV